MTVIKLVRSNITKDKNAILANYDSDFEFDKALVVGSTPFEIKNNTYFKHNLNTSIKIEIDQSRRNAFNYCYIQNEGERKYYYFITDAKWTSQKSAELTLEMDTIATYWIFLNGYQTWSDSTELSRYFKDRFKYKSSGNTLYRIIDKSEEGLNNPVKYKTSQRSIYLNGINPNTSNVSWYLVYRATSTSGDTIPLECFTIPSRQLTFINSSGGGTSSGAVITASDIPVGYIACFVYDHVGAMTFTGKDSSGKTVKTCTVSTTNSVIVLHNSSNFIIANCPNSGTGLINDMAAISKVETSQAAAAVYGPLETYSPNAFGTGASDFGKWYNLVKNTSPNKIFSSGSTPATTITIHDIDTLDRSDSRLSKIMKLPYPPFNAVFDNQGRWIIPSGWEINSSISSGRNYLKLLNLNTKFSCELSSVNLEDQLKITLPDNIRSEQLAMYYASMNNESKLKHSNYYEVKYTYDSASLQKRLEDVSTSSPIDKLTFNASNSMENSLIWHIEPEDNTYTEIEDYETYLTSSRNLEVPIFTNAYANYVRSGQMSKDTESVVRNNAVGGTLAGLQILGGIIAAASGAGSGIGAGLIISGSSTLIGTANSAINAEQNLQAKRDQLSSQSTSIRGNSDVEMISVYNPDNKLQIINYEPSKEVKESIYNLFRFAGYKSDKKTGNPITTAGTFEDTHSYGWCLHTRRCYDYLECTPIFNHDDFTLNNEVLNNIKERFQQGLTIYHCIENTKDIINSYYTNESWDLYSYRNLDYAIDWNKELENWETWICPSNWN